MYHRFILSPEAREAVAPLEEKIKHMGTSEEFEYIRRYLHIGEDGELIGEMPDAYIQNAPDHFQERFRAVLAGLRTGEFEKSKHHWTVSHPNGARSSEEIIGNESLLISGYIASLLLDPNDFWNREAHGMKSETDWLGTVGAAVVSRKETNPLPGAYKYVSEYDGQTYETLIGGDKDRDLEIRRTNISAKPATDPFGHAVSYRPVVHEDRSILSAVHSTETALFGAVLKYVEQEKIDVPCLAGKAEGLLRDMEERDPKITDMREKGTLTGMPSTVMSTFFHDIPVNPKKYQPLWNIAKEFGANAYGIHLDERRNFCVSHTELCVPIGEPALTIPPAEMSEFVRGIFLQSANHRGRTPLHELASLILYRHSDRFEKDMAKSKKDDA